MQIRSRLAECALGFANWLQPPAKGAGPGGFDPLLDRVEQAEDHALPSAPWLGLGDRLRTRSLKTLRVEAIYALAALHQAHEVAVAVFRERVLEAANDDLDPDQLRALLHQAEEWARDAAVLRHALAVVGPLPVPDAPLAAYLEATPEELDAIEELVAQGEAHAHRALVAEQLVTE